MLKRRRPLRVAVLSSRRTPGLCDLLSDPRRGSLWDLCGVLATDDAYADAKAVEHAKVPFILHPIRAFYAERGSRITDRATRHEFDRTTAELLQILRPDLLLLSSYLFLLTTPMLKAFRDRIVNVHGSDLTKLGPSGLPQYPGLRAVADSILAGEHETRATAHWVTDGVDDGPPILRSRPFPVSPLVENARVHNDLRMLKAYAFAHQEWMLHEAWGALCRGVVRLVATGRVPWGERLPSVGRPPMWDLSEQGTLFQANQAVRPVAYN